VSLNVWKGLIFILSLKNLFQVIIVWNIFPSAIAGLYFFYFCAASWTTMVTITWAWSVRVSRAPSTCWSWWPPTTLSGSSWPGSSTWSSSQPSSSIRYGAYLLVLTWHPPPAGADGSPQPREEVHGQAHPHGPRPYQAYQSGMAPYR
jgi:hypothetical protein